MRMIFADKYCDFLNKYPIEKAQNNFMTFYRDALQYTFECEVEAEPVRHGRWEYVDYGGFGNYRCSNCRAISETQYNGLEPIPKLSKYCPNCGAKMENDNE